MRLAFKLIIAAVAWVAVFALGVLFLPVQLSQLALTIREQVQSAKETQPNSERELKIRQLIEEVLRPTPLPADDFTGSL